LRLQYDDLLVPLEQDLLAFLMMIFLITFLTFLGHFFLQTLGFFLLQDLGFLHFLVFLQDLERDFLLHERELDFLLLHERE
jgi:hypothetical protein